MELSEIIKGIEKIENKDLQKEIFKNIENLFNQLSEQVNSAAKIVKIARLAELKRELRKKRRERRSYLIQEGKIPIFDEKRIKLFRKFVRGIVTLNQPGLRDIGFPYDWVCRIKAETIKARKRWICQECGRITKVGEYRLRVTSLYEISYYEVEKSFLRQISMNFCNMDHFNKFLGNLGKTVQQLEKDIESIKRCQNTEW